MNEISSSILSEINFFCSIYLWHNSILVSYPPRLLLFLNDFPPLHECEGDWMIGFHKKVLFWTGFCFLLSFGYNHYQLKLSDLKFSILSWVLTWRLLPYIEHTLNKCRTVQVFRQQCNYITIPLYLLVNIFVFIKSNLDILFWYLNNEEIWQNLILVNLKSYKYVE